MCLLELIILQGREEEGTSEGVRASVLASNFCQHLQLLCAPKTHMRKHVPEKVVLYFSFPEPFFFFPSLILETDLPFFGTKRCLLLFFFSLNMYAALSILPHCPVFSATVFHFWQLPFFLFLKINPGIFFMLENKFSFIKCFFHCRRCFDAAKGKW